MSYLNEKYAADAALDRELRRTGTPSQSETVMHDIRPGDVIEYPFGMRREIDVVTVHWVHRYSDGSITLRYSFTEYPAGIDWRGFVDTTDPTPRVLSRGVAAVRSEIHSLLPPP